MSESDNYIEDVTLTLNAASSTKSLHVPVIGVDFPKKNLEEVHSSEDCLTPYSNEEAVLFSGISICHM